MLGTTSDLLPERELSLDGYVVVRELSHLSVVHAQDLLLRIVERNAAAGDEVHDPDDDGGHDEGVSHAGGAIGDLVSELDPVVVEPASGDDGDAVEGGD